MNAELIATLGLFAFIGILWAILRIARMHDRNEVSAHEDQWKAEREARRRARRRRRRSST